MPVSPSRVFEVLADPRSYAYWVVGAHKIRDADDGWPAVGTFLVVTGLAGGGLAVGLLMLRSPLLRPLVLMGPGWFTRLAEPGENVPYGAAIALGALVAFPAAAMMQGAALPF